MIAAQKLHRQRWDELKLDDYEETLTDLKPLFDALDAVYLKYSRGSILEVGCGSGRFLQRLAEHGHANVIGSDISFGMMRGARARGFRRLVNAPGESLPFASGRFDTVVATWGVFKYIDRDRGHAEVMRVLRRGGFFLFDLLNSWPGWMDHVWWHYLSKGKIPPRDLAQKEYTLRFNMRDPKKEIRHIERAGFRVLELTSIRYLPFLRSRVKKLGYWHGVWGARFGSNTIFICQKP